jgi:hypothetical protein
MMPKLSNGNGNGNAEKTKDQLYKIANSIFLLNITLALELNILDS